MCRFYDGSIAHLMLFGTSLTADQVSELYQQYQTSQQYPASAGVAWHWHACLLGGTALRPACAAAPAAKCPLARWCMRGGWGYDLCPFSGPMLPNSTHHPSRCRRRYHADSLAPLLLPASSPGASIQPFIGTETTQAATSSPSTTPVSISGSTTATSGNSSSDSSSSGLSGGAVAGIVIGCICAAALVVGAVVLARRRRNDPSDGAARWGVWMFHTVEASLRPAHAMLMLDQAWVGSAMAFNTVAAPISARKAMSLWL